MKKATIVMRAAKACALRLAFRDGLIRHGWKVDITTEPALGADLLVLWGVRKATSISQQRLTGGQVCILERGYLGDRFAWTSVSFGGGLNGRGKFRGVRADPARFEEHFGTLMQPWSQRGVYALLLGQVPQDMSLAPVGGSLTNWYRETVVGMKAQGYDVRFRPHPVAVGRKLDLGPMPAPVVGGTLAEALGGASFAVAFNSNAAVDAVLAGVPTMTADRGSMAWEVTSHSLAAPPAKPDRTEWASGLAWKQYSREEMASGFCWENVGNAVAAV